jgi:hypothetical protein
VAAVDDLVEEVDGLRAFVTFDAIEAELVDQEKVPLS